MPAEQLTFRPRVEVYVKDVVNNLSLTGYRMSCAACGWQQEFAMWSSAQQYADWHACQVDPEMVRL